LLANSILPLSLSMLGLLLLTIEPIPPGIWRWCSGIAFVLSLLFVTTSAKIFGRLDVRHAKRERLTAIVFYVFGAVGTLVIVLQLYNTALLGAFWPFFTGIVFQLIAAVFQFARMILLLPE
jgi:predicted membrane channel-forming protein YqfA (hemolysin III family)